MEDWNSVVENKAHHNTVGPYGLGTRNQRRQMLIDFRGRNRLVTANTRFKKSKRSLYTWKAPGDQSTSIGLYIGETAVQEERHEHCLE
jgi:hypothetical protein